MKHFLTRTAALAASALGALAIGLAPAVSAQEFSGNVTLVSDYSFRGQSQTGRDAAIQGGFDLGFDSGFYIGTWASNVNFGPYSDGADPTYTSMELDLYAGFGGEMSEGSTWDVSIIRFEYPNEGAADYIELALAFSFGDFSVGANYSPEYLGEGGDTFLYPYVGYSFASGRERDARRLGGPRHRRHGRSPRLLDHARRTDRGARLRHRRRRHQHRRQRSRRRGSADSVALEKSVIEARV